MLSSLCLRPRVEVKWAIGPPRGPRTCIYQDKEKCHPLNDWNWINHFSEVYKQLTEGHVKHKRVSRVMDGDLRVSQGNIELCKELGCTWL